MPGERIKASKFMQRCVADVAGQGKDTDAAFAICTAQSQKAGYSEPGSRALTGKGKKREKQFANKRDMAGKRAAYKAATGRADEAAGVRGILARLEEAALVERRFQFHFKKNRSGGWSAEPVPGVEVELSDEGGRWEVVVYDDDNPDGEVSLRKPLAKGIDQRAAEVAAIQIYTNYMHDRDDANRTMGEAAEDEGPDVAAIAHEILRQLGGRRFLVMTGARDLVHAPTLDAARKWPTLSMKLPQGKAKIVQIALAPSDTYTVRFLTRTGKVIDELDDIYAEQLQDVVAQHTGLALSL